MPRTEIDLPRTVERLSILDEDGELDEDLLPDLADDLLLDLHRMILLTRRFDERLLQLQRQGRIGTFAPVAAIPEGKHDFPITIPVASQIPHAVERARDGEGPSLIECVAYRLSLHTTADDPARYRSEEEVEKWEARDPLPRLQGFLADRDLLDDDDLESLEEEVESEIDGARAEAEERMEELGDPLEMFEHLHAELRPYLREQRERARGLLQG